MTNTIQDRAARCDCCLLSQQFTGEQLTCHAEPPARDAATRPGSYVWPIIDPDGWCGRFMSRADQGHGR